MAEKRRLGEGEKERVMVAKKEGLASITLFLSAFFIQTNFSVFVYFIIFFFNE